MIKLAHRRMHDQDGFTLSEVLISVMITGVVVAAAYVVLLAVLTMSDSIEARSIAAEESRWAFDSLSTELRQAEELVEDEGVFEDASPARCSFYCDLDHNSVPERVTYYVQNGSIYRTVAQANSTVPPYDFGADGASKLIVQSLKAGHTNNVFVYYTNDNPPVEALGGQPEDIAAVEVQLVNGATINDKTIYVDESTWVKIRSVHTTID